ncbi:type III secretion system inner membrane ring subunit SctD [Comamonas endophytica]|uniref:Type III secretion system inner membrane ring subunit SctD n=1 Tax=Comamonas endophytica TaxID=2949090 RepID=A0ABY6GCI4_9BURK|nr:MULTISPECIES: type III secretion system inner membrane ring subunit SctD [unclassified Acidovorax]MCD2512855.1 type III secretion system inner membrane ring subunit SctD [Acidovorax sp. D4N7]UYG52797.1 type III secretion system inner membrane ring subunit SctD [Acidovorax sp. 5MLIR]
MTNAHAQDRAAMTPPAAGADLPDLELRVLSGCHQGASLPVEAGEPLRIGSAGDCDVLIGDCGLEAPVRLHLQPGGWTLADADATAAPVHAFGATALLGQVGVTVCAPHVPWQAFVPPLPTDPAQPPAGTGQEVQEMPGAQEVQEVHDVQEVQEVQEVRMRSPAAPRPSRRGQLATGAALALALLAGSWMLWGRLPPPALAESLNEKPAKAALSPQARDDAVKQASLAIALVDPALRMEVTPNAEGGVTVSGWVDGVEQFDRLAQGLSGLRPLPRLAVHTASEMLDVLQDAASAHGAHLQFTPAGSGKVQATGLVATPAQHQAILAQLRERAPQGIEIVDGLRVASMQAPAVRRWLQAQGLGVTEVEWDGEQLLVQVDVNAAQRPLLERLLAAPQSPLAGVPFVLQTRWLQQDTAPARVGAGASGLPFSIRSVVGGPAPYVVLADGEKLQPGGTRSGWQLVAVAPDHIVWNGPKRLEVAR